MEEIMKALISENNELRKNAENQISQFYENDKFLDELLNIYLSSNDNFYKLQSLNIILGLTKFIFKNPNMVRNKILKTKEFKEQFINKILQINDNIIKQNIKLYNKILTLVFKYNFPFSFTSFENFFSNVLNNILNKLELNENDINNLKIIEKLLKSIKFMNNKVDNNFSVWIFNNLDNFVNFIKNKFMNISNNLNGNNLIILKNTISIINSILSLIPEFNTKINDMILYIFNSIKYLYNWIINNKIKLEKYLIKIVNDFSKLSLKRPLYFINCMNLILNFYLELIFEKNINKLIKKTILVFLIRILQSRFYCNEEQKDNNLFYLENNLFILNDFKIFKEYILNKNLIFTLLNEYNENKIFKNINELNDFIEYYDISTRLDINSKNFELEFYSLSKLNFIWIYQLFLKFGECFKNFENLIGQLINLNLKEFNNDILICQYFKIFNIYPKIYMNYNNRNINIPKMNINDCISFLKNCYSSQHNNIYLITIINLYKSWIDFYEDDNKINIVDEIIDFFKLNDPFINYEVLNTISFICKNNKELKLNLTLLIEKILPQYCILISEITDTEICYNLTFLIDYLFKQNTNLFDINVFKNLYSLNFDNIIKNNESVFINNYSEILIKIFLFVIKNDLGLSIIEKNILDFIKASIPYLNENNCEIIMELFLKITKYNNDLTENYFYIFDFFFQKFSFNSDEKINYIMLNILEEFILINVQNYDNKYNLDKILNYLNNLAKDLYSIIYDNTDYFLNISGILSVYTTILLKLLNENNFNFEQFSKIFEIIWIDINNYNNISGNKKLIQLKNQSIILFNRVFILNFENILNILIKKNDFEIIIYNLLQNMKFSSSSNSKKFNFLLIIKLIDKLDLNFIIKNFELLLELTIDAIKCNNNKNTLEKFYKDLYFSGNYSFRKKDLRENHLYEDINLMNIFKESFLTLINNLKQNQLKFFINDKQLDNDFVYLMNN